MQYEYGSANRLGNRAKNQDRWLLLENDDTLLLVVADGMGGHKGGELAAQETIDTFRDVFPSRNTPLENPVEFLRHAIGKAHERIARLGENEEPPFYPRTTCVACIVQNGHAWWGHVGDSRLYLLQNGEIKIRTRDHTYIEELVRHEVITEAEMQTHPMRNYVTYCLGGTNGVPPIAFADEALQTGDMILLCSDGLWSAANVEDILHLSGMSLDTAINRLAEHAEQTSYPHSDNITAMAIRILEISSDSPSEPSKTDTETPVAEDDLNKAISELQQALHEYGSELD